MSQTSSLLDQILSGSNRKLQVLAAQGLVPLPPDELVPIQVALASSPDTEIAGQAHEALTRLDDHLASEYLRRQASERELRYFALEVSRPHLTEAIIRRRDVPRSVLVELARSIGPDHQEILIHRQDAVLDEPEILVSLESNPELSRYVRRRIWEYREHLLPKDKVPPKSADELLAEADAMTDEDVAEAIAEAKERSEVDGTGDEPAVDELTGLNAAEIRMLPPPIRIQLARKADRQLRLVLIRDTNTQVALTVINRPNLPESEVEQIANSRSVSEDVLAAIPKRREWIRKYPIVKALVKNPKTRLVDSLKLVPRITARDLRDLAKDKNVPDGVRQMALRLYYTRRQ